MPAPANRNSFSMPVTAQAADIDELGHVNNIIYLKWVQDVATAHWRAVALPEHLAAYIWVVTRHEVDYLKPTLLGETVNVATWVGEPKGARFDRFVEIRDQNDDLRVRAVTSWALLVAETGRLVRVRPEIAAPFMRAAPD